MHPCRKTLIESPGSKLCATFLHIAKYFKTVRCGCGADAGFFFNLLKTSTVSSQYIKLMVCVNIIYTGMKYRKACAQYTHWHDPIQSTITFFFDRSLDEHWTFCCKYIQTTLNELSYQSDILTQLVFLCSCCKTHFYHNKINCI